MTRFLGAHAAVSNLFNLGRRWLEPNIIGVSGKVRLQNGEWQLFEIR